MRKNLSHIFGCIFFIAFLSDATAQDGIIKGKVVGKEREVLQAATVSAGKKTVLTNNDGEFSFSIKPGTYTLTISYTGYQTIWQEVKVKANETIELNFILVAGEQMNEVRILGSRSMIQRSNMNTPVPVDVISGNQLPRSQTDLTQQLAIVVPSFNSPPQTVGNSNFINPATLRGLGPDETLVLLNGRRLHTSAVIFLQYNMAYGTVCADLNTIPSAAIENIEILRDGAAAQYGSDAIAGVFNIELKKSTGITTVNLHLGQTYKGDGEAVTFNFNRGIRLNKKGFLNFTADIRFRNFTQRNGAYDSTVYYNIPKNASPDSMNSIVTRDNQMIAERGFNRLSHRPIGNPKMLNTALTINGGYPISNKTNLFWTGTVNYRLTEDRASSVYRYPKDTTTVITALYPDGFEPKISNTILDISFIAGIEGKTGKGWQWDISSVFGGNASHSNVTNSNNASQFALGKNAQTGFNPGSSLFTQNTNNINFTRNFANLLRDVKSFTVSFGSEFRIDHYRLKEGEEASWKNYAPGSGRQWGSQGAVGRSHGNTVNKSRYISAAYAELEMDKNEKFLWNLAGRYEYYSDFGGNLAGKLAMRYKFSDRFMLRGSLSNGFRAPAIQQHYFSAINQAGGRNNIGISVIGTYRNDSKEAAGFGISPLEAERSVNVSSGITSKISRHINLTLDAYWIQISNRVILTGQIQRSPSTPVVGRILDSLDHKDIDGVRFFTNAVSTRTKGIDLVVNSSWPIRESILEVSLSANYNKTKIYRVSQPAKNLPDDSVYQFTIINPEERGRLEQAQPRDKIILVVNYKTGKWEFGTRNAHFGKAAHLFLGSNRSRDEFFFPKIIPGLSIGYSPKPGITIKAGAVNFVDTYPDKVKNKANTQSGLGIYDFNGTQIGYNGGYYFVNMTFSF
jgi:iron complex outermembrane receptor protein